MAETSLKDQLIQDFDRLNADLQRHVASLAHGLAVPSLPKGATGAELKELSGILDDESAREMREAIEEGCEQVDPDEW